MPKLLFRLHCWLHINHSLVDLLKKMSIFDQVCAAHSVGAACCVRMPIGLVRAELSTSSSLASRLASRSSFSEESFVSRVALKATLVRTPWLPGVAPPASTVRSPTSWTTAECRRFKSLQKFSLSFFKRLFLMIT